MGGRGKKSRLPFQSELFGIVDVTPGKDDAHGLPREKVRGIPAEAAHTPSNEVVKQEDPLPWPMRPGAKEPDDPLADVARAERELGSRLHWARVAVGRVQGPALGDMGAPLVERTRAFSERCRVFLDSVGFEPRIRRG